MPEFAKLRNPRLSVASDGQTVMQGFVDEAGWIWCKLPGCPPVPYTDRPLPDGLAVRCHSGWRVSDETARDARLHAEAIQHGADADSVWIDADGVRSWPICGGESELRHYADAPAGEQWVEWGAGSYPLRVS